MARERGSIRERSNGTYRVKVYKGLVDGKRKYVSETCPDLKSAQTARTRILRELDTGTHLSGDNTTTKEFVEDFVETKEVTKKTRMDYETRMRLDVYPEFGDTPLQDLNPRRLRKHFRTLGQAPRNLSNRTRQYTYMILKQALEQAKLEGLIRENPMDHVDRPSVGQGDKVQKISVFNRPEMARFLQANQDEFFYPLWLLLLITGLRPSEALALEWRHVTANSVIVEQALSNIGPGEYEIGGTKTAASVRRVSIPSAVRRALESHREALSKYRKIGGWSSDLVFPNKAGGIQDIARLRRKWTKACKRAGVPEIRLYDVRHTHATRLLEEGVTPKAAANRLGHASTKMFFDVYTHLTESQEDELMEAVEGMMV